MTIDHQEDEVPVRKWAEINVNKDFINVCSRSGYRATICDQDQKDEYLSINIDNIMLGSHIREALSLSRFIDPELQYELHSYLYDTERYYAWVKYVMKKFKYKTKGAMFKPMLFCTITLYNQNITIAPWHQYQMGGWDEGKLIEADNVVIPDACTDEELGKAARLALHRCTSAFGDNPLAVTTLTARKPL